MRVDLHTKISEYFGVKELNGLKYGLELEYENAKITRLDTDSTPLTRWKLEKDHSLRNNGIEFISRPTALDKMEITFDQMIAAAKSIGATPTSRCGLHVHVNMTDKTFLDLYNLSVLYTLLEPVIFAEYCSGRQESHFCVPTYTNTVLVENMFDDIQRLRRGFNVPEPEKARPTKKVTVKKVNPVDYFGPVGMPEPLDLNNTTQMFYVAGPGGLKKVPADKWCPALAYPSPLKFYQVAKYAALNYSALKKFGTLEYRQHPSTINKSDLMRWINLLDRLHQVAYGFTDPLDIIQIYDEDGLYSLCARIGLNQTKEVDPIDLEDAVDAATMMAGHQPVDWRQLEWEVAV